MAQFFEPISPEFKVNVGNVTINGITNPEVGLASNGDFVVVWEDIFSENDVDIKFRRFTAEGMRKDTTNRVIAESNSSETSPTIAVANDGSFVTAFVKDNDIYVRQFNSEGTPLGNETLVSTFEQDNIQSDPKIALSPDGSFALVWTHHFSANDLDVRARFFNADGTPLTGDFEVAGDTANESEPAIAMNSSTTVITYTSETSDNSDIYLRRLDSQGNFIDDGYPVRPIYHYYDDININQKESSVTISGNNNIIISWTEEVAANDSDIYAGFFDSSGYLQYGQEFIAVDSSLGNQNQSVIDSTSSGGFVVAYQDETDNSVKYSEYNVEGKVITESQKYDINSSFEQNPALDINGNNMVIVADDDKTHEFDPYARIFESQDLLDTPIYRFQNTQQPGTYLFVGEEERQNINNNFPQFEEEGQAFKVAVQPDDDLIALNRFQNTAVPGTYLYAGEQESIGIRANYPNFKEEGVAFYVYDGDAGRGIDFYRFQNTQQLGTYLFVGAEERQNIFNNYPNFVEEGVAFEALI